MTENTVRGKNIERDDVFVVQDLESGKIIHRMLAWNILSENKIVPLNWRDTKALKELKADLETSHFNSIYEIPVNEGEKKATYLKSGNIIVNSLMLGTFILSPDLKQTHFHRVIPNSLRHNIHDVQVTKDGEFLYFNNIVDDLEEKYFFSAIDRYDPVTNKLSFTYTSNPKAFFFSILGGGVQQVDDDLLFFSHVMEGGFLYSLKQNKVIFAAQGTNGNLYVQKGTLQIKMIDFRNFLKNHGN
jgi:hypothetical protein